MRSYWTGVASAFGLGLVIGGVAVRVLLEKEMREEYDKRFKALESAFAKIRETPTVETPVENEADLFDDIAVVTGNIELTHANQGLVQNDYHKAIAATDTPVEMFVEGGVNDYGMSYIEEEEYQEEDGRFKGQIDILMDEHNPVFLMDGEQIDDWDKRIGDSILVDFYKLVPPGVDPVLYVRNHRTDEDYEVVRVVP